MATLFEVSIPSAESQNSKIEYGTFAPATTGQLPSNLVIATFNIRYAVGSLLISGSVFRRLGLKRPRRRPNLVSSNIRQAARTLSDGLQMPRVDVLALQEADMKTARAGGIHVAQELARKLQMNYAHAPLNIPRGEVQKSNRWYLDFEEHIQTDESGDTGLAMLSRFPFLSTTRVELPWSE